MYVLQVKTGQEFNIKRTLMRKGFEAYTPYEERCIRSHGEWQRKPYLLFAGYVFVDAVIDGSTYYQIRNTTSVISFLGGGKPIPLKDEEEQYIRTLAGTGQAIKPTKVRVLADGKVEILDGVLAHMPGRLVKFDKHAHKAVLQVSICGQHKAVKLSIDIVEDLRK